RRSRKGSQRSGLVDAPRPESPFPFPLCPQVAMVGAGTLENGPDVEQVLGVSVFADVVINVVANDIAHLGLLSAQVVAIPNEQVPTFLDHDHFLYFGLGADLAKKPAQAQTTDEYLAGRLLYA